MVGVTIEMVGLVVDCTLEHSSTLGPVDTIPASLGCTAEICTVTG